MNRPLQTGDNRAIPPDEAKANLNDYVEVKQNNPRFSKSSSKVAESGKGIKTRRAARRSQERHA
jgi:hypothetical protein